MATTDTSERYTAADLTVVDADSHVGERVEEDLMPYIDESNRAVRRFLDGASDVRREIYSSTRTTPAFNQNRGTAVGEGDLMHESAQDAETKLAAMAELDVDHSILTPGINLNLASVNHEQTAVAIAEAYNAWVADTFLGVDGLWPTVLAASQKPDLAAEEIDRYGDERDVVGVQLPASGLVPPAGHDRYDPIYAAAEDHDLPIVMHTGNSATTAAFPVQRTWAKTFVEDHALTFPFEAMWHLVSMIFRGVPERFPDLEVVIQEAGVEWLPWMMWRLDDHYLQNSADVPLLRTLPSEYIRDRFSFTSQPLGHTENAGALASVLEAGGGAETILFATDHPHSDFDPPEELLGAIRSTLDDEDVRGIMGETAIEAFGIDP